MTKIYLLSYWVKGVGNFRLGCLKIEAGRRRNCRCVLNYDRPFVRIKCIYLVKYMPTLITDKFILCDYLFFPLYFLFFIYNSKWF